MIRLEWTGWPGPHRDPERFVTAVKAARPSLTDREIVPMVRRGNAMFKPRHDQMPFQVFGRDVLTADLTQIAVWHDLTEQWRGMLPRFPVEGGTVLPDDPDGIAALALAVRTGNVSAVNRQSLLRPAGLSRSYVWRRENGWVQEVADADADVLRRTPILCQCFRNIDQASGPVIVRTYEYVEGERHRFRNFDEFERFRQEQERKPQWTGR